MECDASVSFYRHVSGGAEEAGMKGWRERAPVEIWYNTHVFLRGGAELSNGEWMKRHGETNAK